MRIVILKCFLLKDLLLKNRSFAEQTWLRMTKGLLFVFILFLSSVQPFAWAEDRIDPAIVQSQNSFALKTFQAIYAQKETPNIFFAPLGPGTFLRFLLPFIKNPVQETMLKFLETGTMSADEIANRSAGLWMISQSKEKEEIETYSPMTVLGNAHVEFKPDFSGRASFFKILPRSYDLTLPGMGSSLDDWLQGNSNKQLIGITRYLDTSSPLVFLHGFYFKGRWSSRFETVSEGDFKTGEKKEIRVPMLASSGSFEFYKDDTFEAVNIPFGTGLYSLYIVMPSEKIGLSDFIKNFTEIGIREWSNQFLERQGSVVFPKFSVESSIDLKKNLEASGLESLFSQETNLFLIAQAPRRIFIGSMEQKSVFQMDTKTIAKPIESLPEMDDSAQHDSFIFKAGRPFVFMLRNNKTRVIAGFGAIEDPSSN